MAEIKIENLKKSSIVYLMHYAAQRVPLDITLSDGEGKFTKDRHTISSHKEGPDYTFTISHEWYDQAYLLNFIPTRFR